MNKWLIYEWSIYKSAEISAEISTRKAGRPMRPQSGGNSDMIWRNMHKTLTSNASNVFFEFLFPSGFQPCQHWNDKVDKTYAYLSIKIVCFDHSILHAKHPCEWCSDCDTMAIILLPSFLVIWCSGASPVAQDKQKVPVPALGTRVFEQCSICCNHFGWHLGWAGWGRILRFWLRDSVGKFYQFPEHVTSDVATFPFLNARSLSVNVSSWLLCSFPNTFPFRKKTVLENSPQKTRGLALPSSGWSWLDLFVPWIYVEHSVPSGSSGTMGPPFHGEGGWTSICACNPFCLVKKRKMVDPQQMSPNDV